MKNNVKFLILVLSLILLSACTLSTGMYAVKEISEAPEDYEFSEQSFEFESGEKENISESGPTPQELLAEKFSAMYEIDEENNAITVISRDYYESYWAEKNGKAEIVSLTSDEVLFIIQDSINLYCKYDKIILNIFSNHNVLSISCITRRAHIPPVILKVIKYHTIKPPATIKCITSYN